MTPEFIRHLPRFEQEQRARLATLLPSNGFSLAAADAIVLRSWQSNVTSAHNLTVSYRTLYESVCAGCSGEQIQRAADNYNGGYLYAWVVLYLVKALTPDLVKAAQALTELGGRLAEQPKA